MGQSCPAGSDRSACHDSPVRTKWCLGCGDWVEPVEQVIEIGPEGGGGWERPPGQRVEMCPNDDGTASGHVLVDAMPAESAP